MGIAQVDADLLGQDLTQGRAPFVRVASGTPSSLTWMVGHHRGHGHRCSLRFGVRGRYESTCLPAMDMWAGSGNGLPAQHTFQYIQRNASLPRWFARVSSSRLNGPTNGTGYFSRQRLGVVVEIDQQPLRCPTR